MASDFLPPVLLVCVSLLMNSGTARVSLSHTRCCTSTEEGKTHPLNCICLLNSTDTSDAVGADDVFPTFFSEIRTPSHTPLSTQPPPQPQRDLPAGGTAPRLFGHSHPKLPTLRGRWGKKKRCCGAGGEGLPQPCGKTHPCQSQAPAWLRGFFPHLNS